MKDAVATMGAILPDDAGGRDAVHVAVVAVVAGAKLMPGMDVGLLGPIGSEWHAADVGERNIGIVDPFIKGVIWPGQRFWLYLYPRTITALSHRWSHPAFPDAASGEVYAPPSAKLAAEEWLKDFCARSDCPPYEETITLARKYVESGDSEDYLLARGSDAHGNIPPEFWTHVETVLGRKIEGSRPAYFSCSC